MTKTTDLELGDAVRHIRKTTDFRPEAAVVLGSGLGSFADQVSVHSLIQSSEIPHYPVGSVQGHAGKLIFGNIRDNNRHSFPLLFFQGRVHFYEIGDIERIVFPIALAHKLGVKTLIVTNAAGGINERFQPGQLMLIKDHLNIARRYPVLSPYRKSKIRPSNTFDGRLQNVIRESARELGIGLQEGVYCWFSGPSYETAAEIRMLRTIGVDAVGMSTVPEIYKARSLGMRVAGISLISNMATGISSTKLSHKEVTETADKAQHTFSALLRELILRIK